MTAPLQLPGWLVYGTMIGLVQLFAMVTFGPLGVSTAYPQFVGLVGNGIFPGFAEQPYLQMVGTSVGWEMMLVLGLMLGALGASFIGRRSGDAVQPVCVSGFEQSRTRKYLRAFIGGFLFIFGARLAGGCTTGHMLSGTAQMALSGLVFGAAVFVSGMIVARLFFREPAAQN
ncbi:MAG: YeeE/YedE thiosulfate transporter family protein [Chloroflexota bacterium]